MVAYSHLVKRNNFFLYHSLKKKHVSKIGYILIEYKESLTMKCDFLLLISGPIYFSNPCRATTYKFKYPCINGLSIFFFISIP